MTPLTITVPNWDKFNPRADRVNYSWFRMQNDFFHDQAVFSLTDTQVILYLFILCECSKKNKSTISVLPSYLAAIRKSEESKIINDLEMMSNCQLITIIGLAECRQSAVTLPSKWRPTDRQTDETNKKEKDIFLEIKQNSQEKKQKGIPDEVKAEWEKSLAHAGRKPNWQRDEVPLFRIFQRVGDWSRIKNALAGFRGEVGDSQKYKPEDHVRINRLGGAGPKEIGSFDHLEAIGERVLLGVRDQPIKLDFSFMNPDKQEKQP